MIPYSAAQSQLEKLNTKREICGSSFATNFSAESQRPPGSYVKPANSSKTGIAFEKPCLYCQQSHILATCSQIKMQPHKERMEFLKLKGLCFGCLTPGPLSNFCKRRIECKEYALRHPDILHTPKREVSVSPDKSDGGHGNKESSILSDHKAHKEEVSCAQVSIGVDSSGGLCKAIPRGSATAHHLCKECSAGTVSSYLPSRDPERDPD